MPNFNFLFAERKIPFRTKFDRRVCHRFDAVIKNIMPHCNSVLHAPPHYYMLLVITPWNLINPPGSRLILASFTCTWNRIEPRKAKGRRNEATRIARNFRRKGGSTRVSLSLSFSLVKSYEHLLRLWLISCERASNRTALQLVRRVDLPLHPPTSLFSAFLLYSSFSRNHHNPSQSFLDAYLAREIKARPVSYYVYNSTRSFDSSTFLRCQHCCLLDAFLSDFSVRLFEYRLEFIFLRN